jgi:hypothetical protein
MTATAPAIELKKSQRSKTLLKQQLIELLRDDIELRTLLQLHTVQNSVFMLKKTKEERLKRIKKHALKRETIEKLQKLFKNEPDFEPISK